MTLNLDDSFKKNLDIIITRQERGERGGREEKGRKEKEEKRWLILFQKIFIIEGFK
jgi:hypothetical protein